MMPSDAQCFVSCSLILVSSFFLAEDAGTAYVCRWLCCERIQCNSGESVLHQSGRIPRLTEIGVVMSMHILQFTGGNIALKHEAMMCSTECKWEDCRARFLGLESMICRTFKHFAGHFASLFRSSCYGFCMRALSCQVTFSCIVPPRMLRDAPTETPACLSCLQTFHALTNTKRSLCF
jgi:hypothetical protein